MPNATAPTPTKRIFFTTMASPIGELLLVGDGETLSGLYMPGGRSPSESPRTGASPPRRSRM